MVILAFSFMSLGGFGGDEPGAFIQAHMLPFRLEQFADTAEGAQADPHCALHTRINRADARIFFAGGQSFVVML